MEKWDWPILRWMNYFGWWPYLIENEKISEIWKYYGYFIAFVYVLSTTVDMFGFFYLIRNGIYGSLFFSISGLLRYTMVYFKFYTTIFQRDQIKEIIDDLNELNEEVLSRADARIMDEYEKRQKRCHYTTYLVKFTLFTFFLWIVRCFIDALVYGKRSLVVNQFNPFDFDVWWVWFCAVLAQSVLYTIGTSAYGFMDSVFGSIAEFILGHIEILKGDLNTLTFSRKNSTIDIKNCIDYHKNIMKLCNKLNSVSTPIVFSHCTISAALICLLIFELTFISSSGGERTAYISTLYLIIFQVFVYCWYCNEISTQCEEIGQSSYLNDWYEGTKDDKKCLLNLMTMTKSRIYFGWFLKTDLDTFMNIMRGAFSYYSFLKVLSGYEE